MEEVYMSSWSSYPSIFTLGHKAILDLLKHEVNVEEKIDGSQFSFGLVEASDVDTVYLELEPEACSKFESHVSGKFALKIRSKGCVMHIDAPEKMFALAAETVRFLAPRLHPGWTYRGEFLARPKHNSLVYDRVPVGNIILFDVSTGIQEYLSYEDKKIEAHRLGLEVVPLLFQGRVATIDHFRTFLNTVSVLGGQNIEGVVVKPKNYNLFGLDKKLLMGKFVSEAFKEVHRKAWAESNPTNKDIIGQIIDAYRTPARWNKAITHLRDAGRLVDDVQDIGPLIKEIPNDIISDSADEIKEALFKVAWPQIRRGLTTGFPEFYKELLLKRSFENDDTTSSSASPLLVEESRPEETSSV